MKHESKKVKNYLLTEKLILLNIFFNIKLKK